LKAIQQATGWVRIEVWVDLPVEELGIAPEKVGGGHCGELFFQNQAIIGSILEIMYELALGRQARNTAGCGTI